MRTGDYSELLEEIATVRGRDITERQCSALSDVLSRIPWNKAVSIVRELCRMPVVPANFYGYIVVRVEEIEREAKKELEKKDTWMEQHGCMSSSEWKFFSSIMEETYTWHNMGLVKLNPLPHCEPMTVEGWVKAGRPKTWSPIIDSLMQGSEPAYIRAIGGKAEALSEFFEAFYNLLVASRIKRTAAAEAAAAAKREKDRAEGIHF